MENRELKKALEQAIKKFDENKTDEGVKIIRDTYSQFFKQINDDKYENFIKSLVVGETLSVTKAQRLLGIGYSSSVMMIDRLLKDGKIEREESTGLYKVVAGKSVERAEGEKKKEFVSQIKPCEHKPYLPPKLDEFNYFEPEIIKSQEEIEKDKQAILSVCGDFNIKVLEIDCACVGYTVIKYKLKLKTKVSVKKILKLDDDMKTRLKKPSIFIYAGDEDSVYIEVPSKDKEVVHVAGLLKDEAFIQAKATSLAFAMGKDTDNGNVYGDICDMKHLLVAGATGYGKSMFIDSLIFSLLYKYSPEQVRLVLVDPKGVELRKYIDVPHLVSNEIITDNNRLEKTLKLTVNEMNRRYKLFGELSKYGKTVANIGEFNAQMDSARALSKIVIVIDELADCLCGESGAVKDCIINLLQKGHSVGIHLVVATARVSDDVIAKQLQASFPTKICFRVIDASISKLMLGQYGAEKLMGVGDFLYLSPNSDKLRRVQGAFVPEPECSKIINRLIFDNKNFYTVDISKEREQEQMLLEREQELRKIESSPFFILALKLVVETQRATIASLQRKFNIGYARAGGIIDAMEELGYISEMDENKNRKIYFTKEQFERKYGDL